MDYINSSDAGLLEDIVRILRQKYDGVMLHLSTPPCMALKLAELVHREKLPTHIVLLSRTEADPKAVSALFSGHIDPDKNIATLTDRLEKSLKENPRHLSISQEIEEAIVTIMNTDDLFAYQFRDKFPVLYRDPFSIDDYRKLAEAYLMPSDGPASSRSKVFVSYTKNDEGLALELCDLLSKSGVTSFLAARDRGRESLGERTSR
ncbi:MAG: hypothetical protein ACJ76Y_00140 [Thermoanaerobaculia bacterium]